MNIMKTIEVKPNTPSFNLALEWSRNVTLVRDKKAAVKSAALKPVSMWFDAIDQKARELRKQREHRYILRIARKVGYCPVYIARTGSTPASGVFTHGTPARKKSVQYGGLDVRLLDFKARKAYCNTPDFRFDTKPIYQFTTNPSYIGVCQSDYLAWDYYSKSTKYPKKIVNTTFSLPSDWGTRVLAQGLANLGGLFTVDAVLLESPQGIRLYAAKWVSQGRGYSLENHTGFIAISGETDYHAETAARAVRGLERKLKQKGLTARLAELVANLDETASKYPDLNVSVDDAKAAGACDYGIKSWCNRVGITDDVVSMAKMAEAYAVAPVQYAKAAVIMAIKRQRKTILA